MFETLMFDTVNEIKTCQRPTFRRPYLSLRLQKTVDTKGLYDTGADVSCMSETVFSKIPLHLRPPAVAVNSSDQFKSAGGQNLKVRGCYNFSVNVGKKETQHQFYVIRDLNEPVILGIDFIAQNELTFCPKSRSFKWKGDSVWEQGHLKMSKTAVLSPLSVTVCKVQLRTDCGSRPGQQAQLVANIRHCENPGLTGGPYLVTPDSEGNVHVPIYNCAPYKVTLARNEFVGLAENVSECEKREINPRYLQAVAAAQRASDRDREVLSPEKEQFIRDNVKLNVPEKFREQYLKVILKNHECVSQHKFDLGRTDTLLHEISLKSEEPVYVKQFKIPDAHRVEVEKHVSEWLKMGVIQPARSKFNSPIFAVAKKNGGIRLVQDFRALNAQTYMDKYSMKDVSECIGDIGRSGSTLFTTIDLTGGFWQLLLQPRCRPYTAFTVPGKGQFQWVTTPMGLLGAPSSFQRLMETVVKGLANVIVYIDDLLLHSSTHEQHLTQLDELLGRLAMHRVKVNLPKCDFGSKDVAYLGFRLTEEGVKPGSDKLKAVAQATPPSNVHEIRQFLGLCNFFRTHVRNFAQITAPLTALTRKDCGWKGGPLPDNALKAFLELQSYLCSEPVVDYPRNDRPYALITDASLGDGKKPGGLGAILAQVNPQGEHCVIAYASRKLQKHEANYTPFLLEMQAAIWGMEHFDTYLRGRHFTLYTDHKPLEKLGTVHTKTLNRLQENMNKFDFEIRYKKGSEMPADYLSRNVVASIGWESEELRKAQEGDHLVRAIRNFLLNKELPTDSKCQQLVKHFSDSCFVEDDLVWRRVKRPYEPSRVVIFLPESLTEEAMKEAHGQLLSGHDGIFKTKERLFQCYYWPGMDADIARHLQHCHKCQLRRKDDKPGPVLVTSLPQASEPNQRMHADLFGPLKTSGNHKKYVLGMTDAFTKYVELVALPNKESRTVAEAIFEKWFCRFGIPLEVITDQGKEFCGELTEDLFKLMRVDHRTTTAYHPQCNSQAEVANKTIAKYLSSFTDDSTLDWENYLAPLMFSYNTSFHRSVKATPFFLTYGLEARQPGLPGPEVRRKFYGESSTDELLLRLLAARNVARQNNQEASDQAKEDHDRKATPHAFAANQLVLLDEHSFLHKNAKLAPNWSGPHRIVRLKNDNNVELKLKNGRSLITHVNRLKPYRVPLPGKAEFVEIENSEEKSQSFPVREKSAEPIDDPDFEMKESDFIQPEVWRPAHESPAPPSRNPSLASPPPVSRQPSFFAPSPARSLSTRSTRSSRGAPVVTQQDADFAASAFVLPPAPVKRGRGRPRKDTALAPSLPPVIETPSAEGGGVVQGSEAENSPHVQESAAEDTGDVQIDVVNSDWTVVLRKKRRSKRTQSSQDVDENRFHDGQRWCPVWKNNFRRYGDTYKTVCADTPVTVDPLPDAAPVPPLPVLPVPVLPAPIPDIVVEPPPEDSDSDDYADDSSTDSDATVLIRRSDDDFESCDEGPEPSPGPSRVQRPGTSLVPGVPDLRPEEVGQLRKLLWSPEPRILRSRGVVLSPEILRKFPETRTRKKKK